MEAAVVARSLDRTLMVPGFQAWVNDETGSKDSFVSFEETFDMQAVQLYVPIVPISRLQHSAAWKDQRVLTTSDYKKARMATYLEHQGLECCPRKSFRKVGGLTSAREIQRIVADEGLSSIQQLGWYSFFSLSRELTLEAARHFVRAPHIRRAAQQAQMALFGKERFLAVHLRREATDIGCTRGAPTVLCSRPGAEWSVETEQVAVQILRAKEKLRVTAVYIATITPAQHPRWARELETLLRRIPGAKSLSSAEAMAETLHMSTAQLTRYAQSLIEQELCATAFGFLGSERSTWTGNVELQRASNGLNSMFFGR